MPQTGNTRYQKFLKKEKAKTKLKGKKDKELPKGTNVTKTNFKVKKIILREQIKQHLVNEVLSKRKLNAKELLSRLTHHNVHSLTEAINELKELINVHPEVLEQNLASFIHGVTPLALHIEKVVRRESLKVLHLLLSNVSQDKLEPFFHVLSKYLRSAMTHIDSRIQEDSLFFMDILILCAPKQASKDFHAIAPNFLDMISKSRVDSKPGRVLTVNLDNQTTSVKWRAQVMHRLKTFLQTFLKYSRLSITQKDNEGKTHIFNHSKAKSFPLFNKKYVSVCYVSHFSSPGSQEAVLSDQIEKIKSYIDNLMPLLFETWVEVSPSKTTEKDIESVLTEDAALILKHTLVIISLLCNLIQGLHKKFPSAKVEENFIQKYRYSFNQNFIYGLPYVTNLKRKQESESLGEETITDAKLKVENLETCYLFIVFNPHFNTKKFAKEVGSITSYIIKIIAGKINESVSGNIINILDNIFTSENNSWNKNLTITEGLLKTIISVYFKMDTNDAFKEKLFSLLCKIALNDKLTHFHTLPEYEDWFKTLPEILLKDTISCQTVDIIHMFAVRNNKGFNSVIKPKLLKVIDNLPKVKITDTADVTSYYRLFSLLYFIKIWDDDSLNAIQKQIVEGVYKQDHGKYIFDTLKLRSGVM